MKSQDQKREATRFFIYLNYIWKWWYEVDENENYIKVRDANSESFHSLLIMTIAFYERVGHLFLKIQQLSNEAVKEFFMKWLLILLLSFKQNYFVVVAQLKLLSFEQKKHGR